jgi:hypothetical protein
MHCIVTVDVHFLGWIERGSTDDYSSAKYNFTSLCDKQYTYVCTYPRRADERQRYRPAESTLSSVCSLMLPDELLNVRNTMEVLIRARHRAQGKTCELH